MNNLLRVASRVATHRTTLVLAQPFAIKNGVSALFRPQITRNLWYLSRNYTEDLHRQTGQPCSCGCQHRRQAHSKAERELVEFLTEEILTERKAQKSKTLPTELEGFRVNLSGADVTLTKQTTDETIKIAFNVNHTVDTDVEPEVHADSDKPELGELKSKPAFKVDITRGDVTLGVHCSFVDPNEHGDEGFNDVFGIDEICIYQGESSDNVYAVSGEVLDSYLYDLILNYLEEKGISNEFVEKLADYSTAYEHSAYIGLLEGLSKFASGK